MVDLPMPLPANEPELDVHRVLRQTSQALHAADARPAAAPLRKRVDAILDLALQMFNQGGVASISTNKLAAELGISPGNFHYHYRTKAALLQAAFQLLDHDLREAFSIPAAILAIDEFVEWQIRVQRVLWRHRYFFGSLEVVIRTAPPLRIPWLELQSALVAELASIHEYYVRMRVMVPPNRPNTISQVAQNGLMLWMSWIRWEFMSNDGRVLTEREENEVIHRLVLHHLSFYEPYHVRSRHASDLLASILDAKLLPTRR